MTSYSPRIYIYKITFEEVLYYYYGVHKEEKYNEYYMGSPITNKWCWELYTPKKQILQLFDFTNAGWIEAQEVEKRIIKPVYNTDKWCLNENCGGIISLDILKENGKKVSEKYSRLNGIKNGKKCYELGKGIFKRTKEEISEDAKKGGKIAGTKNYEMKIGIHGRTKEQMTEDAKKGAEKIKELGIGIHGRTKEQMTEDGKKGGKIVGTKNYEMKIGIFGRNAEQHSIDSKIGGKVAKELGLGIHALTPEQQTQRSKNAAKVTNSQKWMCLETGFITNAGCLSQYQKARGIGTSKRRRIS